jgi:aminoglycoside 3-N-acetyltransferase
MPATEATLTADLTSLGVKPGGVLFVHSSFKSLGEVEGGAACVVAALEGALGASGTLLMPSFNLTPKTAKERAAVWDPAGTPASTGYLTEFFRTLPGTLRSDHPSHSVAARGALARWIVGDHRSQRGPGSPWDILPWGKTYGLDSPMVRALEADAQLLMLGTGYETLTYMHLVEVLNRAQRSESNVGAKHWMLDRSRCGLWWEENGAPARGRVAQAECRLFPVRPFVETLLARVTPSPAEFFRWMDE